MTQAFLRAGLTALALTIPVFAQDADPTPAAQDAGAEVTKDGKEAPQPSTANPSHPAFLDAMRAVNAAKSLSYRCKTYGVGGIIATAKPVIEAEVTQIRAAGGALPGWRMRVTGTSRPSSGATLDFDCAWLASTVEFVDHAEKKVLEKPVFQARRIKPFFTALDARLEEFTAPRPFTKEQRADSVESLGRQTLDGVECEGFLVTMGRTRVRWFLGVNDHLPRRLEKIIAGATEAAAITEISDLRVDAAPESQAGNLRVPVPDGYAEDRPVVAPPPPIIEKDAPAKASTTDDGLEPTAPEPASAPSPAPAGPRPAPDFELKTPAGEAVRLSSLRGTVVVLEFTGSWAISTSESRPEIDAVLQARAGKPVRAFSLAIREKLRENAVEALRPFPKFTLLLDADIVARDYAARTFPCYAVVSAEGDVVLEPLPYAKGPTAANVAEAIDAALRAHTAKDDQE